MLCSLKCEISMPKPRLPHLVKEIIRHGKIIWYVRIDQRPHLECTEPMQHKSLLTTTKLHLPNYKGLYFLNRNQENLLKDHLHGCLNGI